MRAVASFNLCNNSDMFIKPEGHPNPKPVKVEKQKKKLKQKPLFAYIGKAEIEGKIIKASELPEKKEGGAKQIKKVSDKRASQNRQYLKLRKEYLKANPLCAAMEVECTRKATTIHHRKGRIGNLLTDTKYFLPVCMNCHNKIEVNPVWAKSKGYSLSRLSNE